MENKNKNEEQYEPWARGASTGARIISKLTINGDNLGIASFGSSSV